MARGKPFDAERAKKARASAKPRGKNKKTLLIDSFAKSICDGGMEKFQQELDKLEGKEYINAFLQLFEYVKPKLSRMEMKADVKATVKKVGYGKEV
jgi:hypothetical protein